MSAAARSRGGASTADWSATSNRRFPSLSCPRTSQYNQSADARRICARPRRGTPFERGSHIVVLGVEHFQPFEESRPLELGLGPLGERGEISQMPGPDGVGLARLDEPIAGVLSDRIEEVIARDVGSVIHLHKRPIDKRTKEVERARLDDRAIGTNALYRIEPEPAGEHRQPAEHGPLLAGQQFETPVHRRAQRPMPRKRSPCSSGEQAKPILQAGLNLISRQHPYPDRRQLNREWDAVQLNTYRRDGPGILLGNPKVRLNLRCTIGEQLHRLAAGDRHRRRLFGGDAQCWHAPRDLTLHAKRLAARCQTRERWARIEKLVNDGGAVDDDVLAVVEQ
jgi:hypothetical protein